MDWSRGDLFHHVHLISSSSMTEFYWSRYWVTQAMLPWDSGHRYKEKGRTTLDRTSPDSAVLRSSLQVNACDQGSGSAYPRTNGNRAALRWSSETSRFDDSNRSLELACQRISSKGPKISIETRVVVTEWYARTIAWHTLIQVIAKSDPSGFGGKAQQSCRKMSPRLQGQTFEVKHELQRARTAEKANRSEEHHHQKNRASSRI